MTGSPLSFLKQMFGRSPASAAVVSALQQEHRAGGEWLLDPSTGPTIKVSQPPYPESQATRKPPEYWNHFNTAESHYKRKWYDKAKMELLGIRQFGDLHPTARTLLLRTYRKLVGKANARYSSPDRALPLLEEMFQECGGDVTDTDRRLYNKLLDRLLPSSPLYGRDKLTIQRRTQTPAFEVLRSPVWGVKLANEYPAVGKDIRGRGQWRFAEVMGNGQIFAKSVYDPDSSQYSRTVMLHVAADHHEGIPWDIEGEVKLLATARAADVVATVTSALELCLWTASGELLARRRLTDIASQRHEVRSLAVSPDGEVLVATATDRVRLFDRGLTERARWQVPMNPGWTKKAQTPEGDSRREQMREDLATLGLPDLPSSEELKRAFRQMILACHPDRNPDDPEAHQKTTALIQAYERLSREDAAQAFAGLEDAEYYYKVIEQFKVEIPGLGGSITIEMGMTGDPRDWVYAGSVSDDGERVYLATYASKVYCVSREGTVLRTFDVGSGVRSLREARGYIVVHSFWHLHVFHGDRLVRDFPVPTGASLAWGDRGFIIWQGHSIQAYTWAGEIGAELVFKQPIGSVLWQDEILTVDMANKGYVFSTLSSS